MLYCLKKGGTRYRGNHRGRSLIDIAGTIVCWRHLTAKLMHGQAIISVDSDAEEAALTSFNLRRVLSAGDDCLLK